MKIRALGILAVMMFIMAGTALAQNTEIQDAKAFMRTVAAAMGTDKIKTMEYTGSGTVRAFGQSFSVNDDWPRFEMPTFKRVIDFDAKYSREDLTRRQGNNPPRGGGGTPLQGEQTQITVVNGNFAWNVNGTNIAPQPTAAEQRQIDIMLTPHGFVKAALEATDLKAHTMMMALDDGTIGKTAGPAGRKVTYVAFTALGKYQMSGAVDDQLMLERAQTWMGNPLIGDHNYQWDFKAYKDWGNGIKFPTNLHQHTVDVRFNGHHGYDINVSAVTVNGNVGVAAVPDNVRNARPPAVQIATTQLANGVWLIGGGSHNSVAIEFKDFITVVEAPLNEERSLAVIKEVQKLIPNKMIRYLVVTHHHFDHSGGIRTYATTGATLIVHDASRQFYEEEVFYPHPRLMMPDVMSLYYPRFAANKLAVFDTVRSNPENRQKHVISDGTRTLELHPMQGLNHAADMLLAYLPTEKILINADLYSPAAPNAQPPAVNPNMTSLNNNIQRLRLDVQTHVPIHGVPGPHADFVRIMSRPSNN
jgi:glyoxylase-like metal-dependent hydrolase (beta-lactamase superfamily II)